ncbi:hypothetical protein KI688_001097 [Linnemannia hyalina]|uniref:Uncharacterized protein n=1 Tax=Linnemannia hyalina TaxID=64524 RepID=A0A9P7Y5I4_9FUNG|nr:hypothetical protein KI688_001097 [Linnemannia hyalina]
MRSDPSSSTSPNSASAISPTISPNAGMNHKERRNFSGSARSRLTKIDRLSKMMLITNASAPNTNTGAPTGLPRAASPRRVRLSLQSQSGTAKEVTSAASAAAAAAAAASPVKIHGSGTSKSGKVGSPTSSAFKGSRQAFGASHTAASNNYPRHIVMRAASPHCILDDAIDSDAAIDSFSTSLPSASGFPAGVDPAVNSEPAATPVNTEKANRHASMPPLPKAGWRLYDVPDVEESNNSQHGHDDRPGFDNGTVGSGGGDERSIFHYSASNASSTTNLEHYPYSHHAAHARQDSTTSTFYTMTPNASNLDLSMPMSNHNLSSIDPSTDSSSSATSHGHSHQGPTPTPSIYNMPPPLPKAIKNKSPLALRRSSTTSSSSSSSPSNTYPNKGSFPKSSLSSTMIHNSKTLTQERQKIILEILRTERSYVDGLVILQTLFYEPLNAPYATSGYPYSGANTTTSIYSAANTTLQHNKNTNKHPNPNNNNGYSGWSGATNPTASSSTLSLAAGQYPTSTMGSNSTLAASAAPLLPKKSVNEIFSNFSEILQINTLLLTQLETRICGTTFSTGWESDEDETEGRNGGEDGGDENDEAGATGSRESKANGKPNQVLVTVGSQAGEQEQLLVLDADWCVGDIFVEIAPFLKMYSNYVKTYTSALTHINDCMNRNDRFTEFLKSTARRPECKSLDFQSYLMLPVQRIPRYRMLLEGLLRHTPEEHPDHRKLQTAFESMEQTANFVNETIRQHEMFGEMIGLRSKITGMSEPLIIPGRVMLKRGNVWKVCRRNVQLRMIILFSDCIVWTSPSLNPLDDTLTFHRKVGLENCTVVGAEDPDPTKNAFQIMSPEKSSQVYVNTPREKEAWMVAIRRATQEYLSAKRTLKISITPMQSISAAATSFGAGLLRRDTGLWSPTSFGSDSRAHTFAGHQQQQLASAEPEVSSPWSATFGVGFASAIGSGGSGANGNGGSGAGSPTPRTQPMRVIENYNAPVWVPDQSATRCMICTEEFGTIFRRKHHCRACGKVVCHSCSSRTILIKGAHSEKVGRACDDCIETMFPEEASMPVSPTANSNSAETSPIESPGQQQQQQQVQSNNQHQVTTDRRASNQSLDGVLVRPEDYSQDSGITSGATGMVRGIVEAGLSRMKSRTGPITSNQDTSSGQNGGSPNSTRGSNRKSDASLGSPNENQNNVKACELCKTEFNLFKFKWRNVCSQCRKVVCSDCLTKKQIDQLFLLGLEAEREAEAKAREGGAGQLENDGQVVDSLALNFPLASPESPDLARPGLLQSASDSVVATGSADAAAAASALLSTKRSQSFNVDQTTSTTATSGGGGYGGFGTGWRGIKGNTDSGHGHSEKLCDPCYLGLSSDQIKVLETGGGWQYYQATLGKHQTQDVIAALAMAHLAVDGEEGAGEDDDEEEEEESPVDAMTFVGSDAFAVEVSPVQAG